MKIGILQTGHAPDEMLDITGDVAPHFERLLDGFGFTFETYSVVDMAFPAAVTDCDGWLITGSKHGAYEDIDFIEPLQAFIKQAYAANVPMVGICFGHQIIAQALGGRVEKFDGGWSVGRQSYDWQGRELYLNAWHQDQVVEKPSTAQVYATNAFCENAALVYADKVFTIQPHPEYGATFIGGLIDHRGPGVVPDDQLQQAQSRLSEPVDNSFVAGQIAQFFKERTLA